MKVILTIDQLRRILERPDMVAKYPITADLSKVSKREFNELVELLKKKRKG